MWKKVKLENTVDFVRGLTYSKKDEVTAGGLAILRATNVSLETQKITLDEIRYIKKPKKLNSEKIARTGDILMCTASGSKSHLGKVALVTEDLEMAFGGFMAVLRCRKILLPEYLFYVLTSKVFADKLATISEGTNINNLKYSQISNFEFKLPSLTEQQRVITKLDAVFAKIDQVHLAAKTKIAEIANLKIALLKCSLMNESENWKHVKLYDICTLRNGRSYKKAELLKKGKYQVLRVGNFFTSDQWYYSNMELDDTKYCDCGDLLYAWSASFGVKIWKGNKVIFHYHIWRVDVKNQLVDKKFLFYWFEFDKEQIKIERGTGTTMIHVSKGSMEERKLYLPSLKVQRRIVAKLDEAFEQLDRASDAITKSIENYKALKSAILSQELQGSDT